MRQGHQRLHYTSKQVYCTSNYPISLLVTWPQVITFFGDRLHGPVKCSYFKPRALGFSSPLHICVTDLEGQEKCHFLDFAHCPNLSGSLRVPILSSCTRSSFFQLAGHLHISLSLPPTSSTRKLIKVSRWVR